MAYVDNVLTTLHSAITSTSSTTIKVVKADTSKYNDIPTSGSLTIKDSLSAPAKVPETITYTGRTDNTTYWTLTGVTREAEGTTANTWLAGHIVYQAVTAEILNEIYYHSQESHAPSNATADQTKADIDSLGINAATTGGHFVLKTVPSTASFENTRSALDWIDDSDDVILRLTETNDSGSSAGGPFDLTVVAGTNITLTPSGDNLTIATPAQATSTALVTAAGALMDSELTNLSGVKTLTVPDSTTISAFGKTLVDDADQAAARTTLGVDAAGTINYTHPTTDGNKHIPSGGSSGQFLKYSSAGTAVWASDNNTTYSVGDAGLTQKNFTTTLKDKLDGIEISALPTLSKSSNVLTISNYSSYTDAVVSVAGNGFKPSFTQDGAALTFSSVTFLDSIVGISVAENNKLARTVTQNMFGPFRYYRISGLTQVGSSGTMLNYLHFFTSTAQDGTRHPSNMTSASAPSPLRAEANHYHSSYPGYLTFGSGLTTGWWTLGSTATEISNAVLWLDLGANPPSIASVEWQWYSSYYSSTITLEGSNTSPFDSGSGFSGEQTLIFTKTGQTGSTFYTHG